MLLLTTQTSQTTNYKKFKINRVNKGPISNLVSDKGNVHLIVKIEPKTGTKPFPRKPQKNFYSTEKQKMKCACIRVPSVLKYDERASRTEDAFLRVPSKNL